MPRNINITYEVNKSDLVAARQELVAISKQLNISEKDAEDLSKSFNATSNASKRMAETRRGELSTIDQLKRKEQELASVRNSRSTATTAGTNTNVRTTTNTPSRPQIPTLASAGQGDPGAGRIAGITTETQKASSGFSSLKGMIGSIGPVIATVFAVDKLISFTGAVFKSTAEAQKYEQVLKNQFQSGNAAKAVMKDILDFASKTPFSVNQITESFIKLAGNGFKPTTDELTKLGDLASSKGKSFDQLAEALIDAESAEFERLKEFGIKSQQNGDKVSFTFKGVTQTVDKSAESIRKYVLGLGSAVGVAGSMAAISGTLEGQLSNLEDTFDQLKLAIGQRFAGAFASALSAVSKLMNGFKALLEVPVEEKVRKEQLELNSLVMSITRTNVSNEERKGLMTKLNAEYPGFIGNLNKETASNDELLKRLKDVNAQYVNRAFLAKNAKKIEELAGDIADNQGENLSKATVQLDNIKAKISAGIGLEKIVAQFGNINFPKEIQNTTQQLDYILEQYGKGNVAIVEKFKKAESEMFGKYQGSGYAQTTVFASEEVQQLGELGRAYNYVTGATNLLNKEQEKLNDLRKKGELFTKKILDSGQAVDLTKDPNEGKKKDAQKQASAEKAKKDAEDAKKRQIELLKNNAELEKLRIQNQIFLNDTIAKDDKQLLFGKKESINEIALLEQELNKIDRNLALELLKFEDGATKDLFGEKAILLQKYANEEVKIAQKLKDDKVSLEKEILEYRKKAAEELAQKEKEIKENTFKEIDANNENKQIKVEKASLVGGRDTVGTSIISVDYLVNTEQLNEQLANGEISLKEYQKRQKDNVKIYEDEIYKIEFEAKVKSLELDKQAIERKLSVEKISTEERDQLQLDFLKKDKEIIDARIDYAKQKESELTEKTQEEEDKRREIREAFLELGKEAVGAVFELGTIQRDAELAQIQENKEKELAGVKDNAAAKAFIEQKYKKQEQAIKRQQAVADRDKALFDIAVNTAVAVAKAVAETPATFGLPFSAFALVSGAIQAGIVLARPLPKFAKGVLDLQGAGTGTSDSIQAMLSKGESVMTAKETRNFMPTLKAIRSGTIRPEVINAVAENRNIVQKRIYEQALTASFSDRKMVEAINKNTEVTQNQALHQSVFDSEGFSTYTVEKNKRTKKLHKDFHE